MDIKNDQSMEQTILEVAEKLFLEKGFASTSTTQIAKGAGCNQALVHYYFRTKENLFNTIFEQKFRYFFEHIFEIKNLEKLPFEQKVRHVVESHFDFLRQNPKIPLLVSSQLSRLPEQIQELRSKLQNVPQELLAHMNAELQHEIAAGHARDIDMLDIILTMVMQNVGLFIMLPMASGLLQLSDEQLEEIITHRREENVQVVLRYIKP
jgi:AcrR family transcriptional regulator